MYCLEKLLGRRQPVGVPAHRGTAVEAGVALGLADPDTEIQICANTALQKYDTLTALSGDPRRSNYRADIPGMVQSALDELRPYGRPTTTQGKVEWRPEGLKLPIIGFYDFEFAQHGLIVDLKTTERMPSEIKVAHARQVALYASSDNMDARLTYVTPRKRCTYQLENIREHRQALHKIAATVERFLAISSDPAELVALVCPDIDSFYWSPPEARATAFEVWGV